MSPFQLLTILWRRAWIVALVFASAMLAAGLLLYILPPRYEAQATATIDPSQLDPVTGQATGIAGIRVMQGNLVALAKSQRVAVDVVRRLALTGNSALMAQYRASDSAGRVDAADWIAAELLRGSDARFNEGTNILIITYRSSNPLLVSQVANTFMAAFTDAAIDAKVSGAQQIAQWFEPQIEKLRLEVEEARQRVMRYQTANRLAPTGTNDVEMNSLQQASNDLATARAELLKVRTALSQNLDVAEGQTAPQPFDSPLMQSLKSNLANTLSEIGKLQASVGANNPRLLALVATQRSITQQINAERREIRAQLQRRLKTLEAEVASFEGARADQLASILSIQEQRGQLAMLGKDLEVKQERHIAAMRASSTARLQGQLSFSNIASLDRAVTPIAPSFPKPTLVIPAAMAAGFGLGVILALIVEAFNRKIRVVRDLEFAALVPQLGVLLSGQGPARRRFRITRTVGQAIPAALQQRVSSSA